MNKLILTGAIFGLTLMLGACQSLPHNAQNTPSSVVTPLPNLPANTALSNALRAQLKSNFSYHTQVMLSAYVYEESALPSDSFACEDRHDKEYVALAQMALKADLDISADVYLPQKDAIKAAYQACQAMRETLSTGDVSEAETVSATDDIEAAAMAAKNAATAASVAVTDTALSTASLAVLNSYLLHPTRLQISGSYRPVVGELTMLPSADYALGRMTMHLNQPIYIDLKNATIYLWADNLAMANASFLDKKLGLAWQNKWLKLPLNDGSLPADFVTVLTKAILKAQQATLTDDNVSYVPSNELPLSMLTAKQQAMIAQTPMIIAQEGIDRQALIHQVADTLYAAYPELRDVPSGDTLTSQSIVAHWLARFVLEIDNQSTQTRYYGLDKGQVLWVLKHSDGTLPLVNQPVMMASFTQFDSRPLADSFPKLATDAKKPTVANSVDMLAYVNSLKHAKAQDVTPYLDVVLYYLLGDAVSVTAEAL